MALRVESKLTFIHINQNAGTSITRFLRDNFHCTSTRQQHDTYPQQVEKWQKNAFAGVRNTYDRVVTLYEHDKTVFASKNNPVYMREYALLEKGFDFYIKHCQDHRFNKTGRGVSTRMTWTEQTQLRFLPADMKNIKLINFHNLDQELYALLKQNDLVHKKPIGRFNQTPTRTTKDYRKYYTEETKEIVYNVFKEEIKTLKFKF